LTYYVYHSVYQLWFQWLKLARTYIFYIFLFSIIFLFHGLFEKICSGLELEQNVEFWLLKRVVCLQLEIIKRKNEFKIHAHRNSNRYTLYILCMSMRVNVDSLVNYIQWLLSCSISTLYQLSRRFPKLLKRFFGWSKLMRNRSEMYEKNVWMRKKEAVWNIIFGNSHNTQWPKQWYLIFCECAKTMGLEYFRRFPDSKREGSLESAKKAKFSKFLQF
jgi:hypothetical protein